jgi:hypothetical protein
MQPTCNVLPTNLPRNVSNTLGAVVKELVTEERYPRSPFRRKLGVLPELKAFDCSVRFGEKE